MIIKIYDFFKDRAKLRVILLLSITVALITSLLTLSYKEDITDFLSLTPEEKIDMAIYQDISGANKLEIIFSGNPESPDSTTEAMSYFYRCVKKKDTEHWTRDMVLTFDLEKWITLNEFVYRNIPYFLTEDDYIRMDSILSSKEKILQRLKYDHEVLTFPLVGMLSGDLYRDPLNLFSPVTTRLQKQKPEMKFEMYNGYIFTPDMSKAVVMLSSPFGNTETSQNSKLIDLLEDGLKQMKEKYPGIEAHVSGGPKIAVDNAKQIRQDSILALSLASLFIVFILVISFHSFRNILLILVSIGWGWLLALGGIALFLDKISIIVIGISSIILGIAVNYPLHLIAHTSEKGDTREAMKEIFEPLLVGNITTVGAFIALIPLDSVALRDLGLFASLMLLGTIFYVLIFLPHQIALTSLSGRESTIIQCSNKLIDSIANVKLDNKPWLITAVIILTAVFGWYSLQIKFDSNISDINYVTDQQKEDIENFQKLIVGNNNNKRTVYLVSSGITLDEALNKCQKNGLKNGVSCFLPSQEEQKARLKRWNEFRSQYNEVLHSEVPLLIRESGFSTNEFTEFFSLINAKFEVHKVEYFAPLINNIFSGSISQSSDKQRIYVVDKLEEPLNRVKSTEAYYPGSFDIESLNSKLADSMSDNFNYIGWACSLIVFFFLWFSFRRIELAIISFIPMAVSWLWILGLMALLNIKFNIVNIILATFIFGQGDDYTIFMTEGCLYEHEKKKPILASYKRSILLSAFIMFVGIGTLIVAQHPALHSLAEVTIVGMFSVVFMSWLIPPFLFRLLTKFHKHYNVNSN